MNNYFRSDGWVKTTLGPAIPGAQVFVCTQPANINSAPPSPLANIYADNAGLVPIAQPMLTDGFGHYDFYAEAGVYTLVIAYAGTIQEVYPDQSVGAVGSGGGGALTLEANGEALPNQVLLNFYSSDATVTFTADEDGDGGLNLQAKGGGNFSTSGQGGFFGPGITTLFGVYMTQSQAQAPTADDVYVWQFMAQSSFTLRACTALFFQQSGSGNYNFAIYDSNGNLVVNPAPFSYGNTFDVPTTNTFSPVVLPPGTYYFAQACNEAIDGPYIELIEPDGSPPTVSTMMLLLNAVSVTAGIGTNKRVGTTMPSTLGTIVVQPVNGVFPLAVIWTP